MPLTGAINNRNYINSLRSSVDASRASIGLIGRGRFNHCARNERPLPVMKAAIIEIITPVSLFRFVSFVSFVWLEIGSS